MKKTFFLTILFSLLSIPAYGRITMNVGMVYKKGIDKGLILVNELHSVKEFFGTEINSLQMKNGFRADLKAYFTHREKDYGPSAVVRVMGSILNAKGEVIREFKRGEADIPLGSKQTLIHKENEGQQIELTFEPYIK